MFHSFYSLLKWKMPLSLLFIVYLFIHQFIFIFSRTFQKIKYAIKYCLIFKYKRMSLKYIYGNMRRQILYFNYLIIQLSNITKKKTSSLQDFIDNPPI